MKTKIILVLLLVLSPGLLAQVGGGGGISGGGSGGGGGASPAGSIGDVQSKLNGTTFQVLAGFKIYPSGIPDPLVAPTVVVNTTGMTTRIYSIVESNGIGWTLPSPSTTVTNSSNGVSNDSVTLPVVADANVSCFVLESVALVASLINACDGSTIVFNGIGSSVVAPASNTTIGLLLPGGIGLGQNNSLNVAAGVFGIQPLFRSFNFVDPFGNNQGMMTSGVGSPASGDYPGIWTGTDNAPFGVYGSGFWEDVATATGTFAITENHGIVKCDSAGGSVTLHLPTSVPLVSAAYSSKHGYGRQYIIHKPKAANSCTISTTDGTLINGASTYVLTNINSSVQLYWDGDADGNTGQWASQAQDPGSVTDPSFTTIQATGHAFASLGTPSNGTLEYCSDCTVTSGSDNTCAASGTGSTALRINGAWKCEQ